MELILGLQRQREQLPRGTFRSLSGAFSLRACSTADCVGYAGYGGMEGFWGLQGILFQGAFWPLWELSTVLQFCFRASTLSTKIAFFGGATLVLRESAG